MKRVVWASSETVLGLPFDTPPAFAPIDETIEPRPESSYALSKLVGETMAAQFARRSGIGFVGLRISNIMEPDDYARFPSYWDDPHLRKWNLWGYVDARDVATAVRLALETPIEGAEVAIIAAADTVMVRPSADLMAEVFPTVPMRRPVEGSRDAPRDRPCAAAPGIRAAPPMGRSCRGAGARRGLLKRLRRTEARHRHRRDGRPCTEIARRLAVGCAALGRYHQADADSRTQQRDIVTWEELDRLVAGPCRAARGPSRSISCWRSPGAAWSRPGCSPTGCGSATSWSPRSSSTTTHGQPGPHPTFLQFPADPLLRGQRILVVDEVWDSGTTIHAVIERIRQAGGIPTTAVLHCKPTHSVGARARRTSMRSRPTPGSSTRSRPGAEGSRR